MKTLIFWNKGKLKKFGTPFYINYKISANQFDNHNLHKFLSLQQEKANAENIDV